MLVAWCHCIEANRCPPPRHNARSLLVKQSTGCITPVDEAKKFRPTSTQKTNPTREISKQLGRPGSHDKANPCFPIVRPTKSSGELCLGSLRQHARDRETLLNGSLKICGDDVGNSFCKLAPVEAQHGR